VVCTRCKTDVHLIGDIGWFHHLGYMEKRFVTEEITNASVTSVDSSMICARNGHVWHRKQIVSGKVPGSGIDTDVRWGSPEPKDGCLATICTCHTPLTN